MPCLSGNSDRILEEHGIFGVEKIKELPKRGKIPTPFRFIGNYR